MEESSLPSNDIFLIDFCSHLRGFVALQASGSSPVNAFGIGCKLCLDIFLFSSLDILFRQRHYSSSKISNKCVKHLFEHILYCDLGHTSNLSVFGNFGKYHFGNLRRLFGCKLLYLFLATFLMAILAIPE